MGAKKRICKQTSSEPRVVMWVISVKRPVYFTPDWKGRNRPICDVQHNGKWETFRVVISSLSKCSFLPPDKHLEGRCEFICDVQQRSRKILCKNLIGLMEYYCKAWYVFVLAPHWLKFWTLTDTNGDEHHQHLHRDSGVPIFRIMTTSQSTIKFLKLEGKV